MVVNINLKRIAIMEPLETVLMLIDNCQPVLTNVLQTIKKHKGNEEYAIILYIETRAALDMRNCPQRADKENAPLLALTLRKFPVSDWRELCKHYTTKAAEYERHAA
jgi:hypothetical protein